MENKENKLIADKINSLDYLPEGYQPNLEAKWALLQSENNKNAIAFLFERKTWLKIAACLIILFLSGIIWMNNIFKNKTETAINNQQRTVPEIHQSNKITNTVEHTVEINLTRPNKLHKKSHVNSSTVIPQQKPIEQELAVTENTYNDSTIDNSEITTQPVAEIKIKKHRYVQIDFADQVLPVTDKSTFAQGFQFKIGIKNSETMDRTHNENSVLKLKRNF